MTAIPADAVGTQGVSEEDLVIFHRVYADDRPDTLVRLDSNAGVYQTWQVTEGSPSIRLLMAGQSYYGVQLYSTQEATAYVTAQLRRNEVLAPSLHGDDVTRLDFTLGRTEGPDVTVYAAGSHDSLYGGRLVRCVIPVFGLDGESDGTMSIMVEPAVAGLLNRYGFDEVKYTEYRVKQLLRTASLDELLQRALDLHDIVSIALGRLYYGTAEPYRSPVPRV